MRFAPAFLFALTLAGTALAHKCNLVDGLTSQYAIYLLVHFERFETQGEALLRERALKSMHRSRSANGRYRTRTCDFFVVSEAL